jgi:hypothetical protein
MSNSCDFNGMQDKFDQVLYAANNHYIKMVRGDAAENRDGSRDGIRWYQHSYLFSFLKANCLNSANNVCNVRSVINHKVTLVL